MKTRIYSTALIMLALLLAAGPLCGQIMNTVRGTITDKENGAPLADVKITIVSTKSSVMKFELLTDANGYFYKGGLETGTYRVTIEKNGYIPVASSLYLSIGETKTIENALEKLAPQAPASALLLDQAVELINEGKYPRAMEKLTAVLEKEPDNPAVFYYSGLIHERNGDLEKAAADLEKAINLKDDFTLALGELAKIRAKKRDFAGAEQLFKKAYSLGADDPTTLFNYGSTLINLGRGAEAGPVFEKLISIDPEFSDAYYELGIIALGNADQEKARELLAKYLELSPEGGNSSIAREILKTLK